MYGTCILMCPNVKSCTLVKKNLDVEYTTKLNDDEQKINTCDEEKDLGITCNKMLSFDLRIQNVTNKAKQMIGLIKRTFTYLNKDMFIKLYEALVRPHLECDNISWYPCLKRQSVAAEQVLRRETTFVGV